MFQRARLRLTAYYVLFLMAILAAFDVGVIALTDSSLRASAEADLRDKADHAAATVGRVGAGALYIDQTDLTSDPSWSDVVCHIASREGSFDCPTNRTVPSVLPERSRLASAMNGVSSYNQVGHGRSAFMVFTRPVYAAAPGPGGVGGDVVAVVQVGRSVRSTADALQRLTELLLAATTLALGLTFVAGSWLAGRTLQPIQRNVERQKQFVGDASHELRTPMTVIRTAAEALLRRPGIDRRVRELAEDIVTEAQQVSRLVDELGALATHDARRERVRRDALEVRQLFDDVAASGRHLAAAAGLGFESHLEGEGVVMGDPVRLRQLFAILLDNAVKFSPPGGIVAFLGRAADRRWVVRVIDRGQGIPEADLPRVFERFFRGASERRHEGTGLGLAIAKALVDEHRGTISVRSRVGEGSELVVELPLAVPPSGGAS